MAVNYERLNELIEAQLENYPRKASERFSTGRTYNIGAGQRLTVTFAIEETWLVRILKAYCDSRSDCDYWWIIEGKSELINEIEYRYGRTIHGDVKLIVENTTADDQEVACRLDGWGDYKGV